MVGQVEPLLECARGDAAMQVGAIGLVLLAAGRNDQAVFALLDIQILGGETGHRDRDAIGVVVGLFDIVGRIGRGAGILGHDPVQQVRHTVKADTGAVKRGEIMGTHGGHPLCLS